MRTVDTHSVICDNEILLHIVTFVIMRYCYTCYILLLHIVTYYNGWHCCTRRFEVFLARLSSLSFSTFSVTWIVSTVV